MRGGILRLLSCLLLATCAGEAGADQRETAADAKVSAGLWLDARTGLMWSVEDNGSDITWPDAGAFCESATFGGYSDWELPAIDELHTLYDPPDSIPVEGRRVTGPIELSHLRVWSSTQPDPSKAWSFLFIAGKRASLDKDNALWARALCVRRPEAGTAERVAETLELVRLEEQRWVVLQDMAKMEEQERDAKVVARFTQTGETVVDTATGLEWAGSDNGSSIDWDSAHSYCEGLDLGGESDWGLPTVAELEALYRAVEDRPSQRLPCSNVETEDWDFEGSRWQPVPGIQASCELFWTAEPDGEERARAVDFRVGSSRSPRRDSIYSLRALCVRRSGR